MTDTLHRLATFVLRAVLLTAGLVFTLSLLLAGTVLAVVAVVAGLLMGRRPAWRTRFAFDRDAAWQRFRTPPGAPRPSRPTSGGEVIDAEVREIVTAPPAGHPDRP